MPENRPYDANLLQGLTKHIEQNGPVISSPTEIIGPSVIHDPGFEHHPGRISEAVTAIAGLRSFLTLEGREERAATRAEVTAHVAQRLSSPRQTGDPREKLGWTGTHKRVNGAPRRPEDEVNLGFQLMDNKNLGPLPTPNLLRPTTRAERRDSDRLERQWHKINAAKRDSKWLSDSYGQGLSSGSLRSSFRERQNMHATSSAIAKDESKAAIATARFNAIVENAQNAHRKIQEKRVNKRGAATQSTSNPGGHRARPARLRSRTKPVDVTGWM